MENVFDALGFYDTLKAADVPEKQARAQAEAMRDALVAYDANRMKELATKGDVREAELRLQKEIEKVRAEIQQAQAELRTEMQKMKYDMLKWQFGIAAVLATIMAKGFGWIGF